MDDVFTAGQEICPGVDSPPGGGVKAQVPVGPPTQGAQNPQSPGGLGSNCNYIMYTPTSGGGCENLLEVSVTIDVTEDIVFGSGPLPGFSFQLNCYSPSVDPMGVPYVCAWQQYVIGLNDKQLVAGINSFTATGGNIILPSGVAYQHPLGNPLTGVRIPAGYKMSITLGNDGSGNVTSATWVVPGTAPFTVKIQDILKTNGLPVTDVAPIVAFEMNLLGPVGNHATLSSGAGKFTYSAMSGLTVVSQEPACVAIDDISAETANSTYGELPPSPGNPFTQTFGIK